MVVPWQRSKNKKSRRIDRAFLRRKEEGLGDWRCRRCAIRNFRRRVECRQCGKVWASTDTNLAVQGVGEGDGELNIDQAQVRDDGHSDDKLVEGKPGSSDIVPLLSIGKVQCSLWGQIREGWSGNVPALADWLGRKFGSRPKIDANKVDLLEVMVVLPLGISLQDAQSVWRRALNSPFVELLPWNTKFAELRISDWWFFSGVPPQAWCEENFKRVASKIGEVEHLDFSCKSGRGYGMAKVKIRTSSNCPISVAIPACMEDQIIWVKAEKRLGCSQVANLHGLSSSFEESSDDSQSDNGFDICPGMIGDV
ncbi:uncharacterized protein LOC143886626 [Tasmannia lanceolata]|uniref:uncharacterized protein LOC143886626 n=1 Tax=Tasmannia lanceolata TaxID=3420 RepID=UPI004063FDCF